MKTIALKPFYGKPFQHNKIFSVNNGNNIFFKLDKDLKKHNIEIVTLDQIKNNEYLNKIVYCDIPYPWEFKNWLYVFRNKKKNLLFCFDSPIVTPFSHISLLYNFFSKIYTWNDDVTDNKRHIKFYVPQLSSGINTKAIPFAEKKFITLINSNKSSPFLFKFLTKYSKDLYEERLKAIRFFEKNHPELLDLYGRGWDRSKFSTYKGEIKDEKKISILSRYKFCICFENATAPGYITEKIFDCFKARCVPIYWGATNITKHIDKNTFIDFRKFMDYEKLTDYLKSMPNETYNGYISSIEKYLNNPETKSKWFENGFRKTFLKAIE